MATTNSEELGTMPLLWMFTCITIGEAVLALAGLYIVLVVVCIDLSGPFFMG